MLARARFRLFIFLAAFGFVSLPLSAQINGVPANGVPVSATPLGFGARGNPAPGTVRASVTPLGLNGYGNWSFLGNCCSIFSLPAHQNSANASGRHHRHKDRSDIPVGVLEPVYVPYAVPYVEDGENENVNDRPDDSADEDAEVPYAAPLTANDRVSTHTRTSNSDLALAQAPVAAQPSTVLVFKDGHQSNILNYAIVGETLFDFSTERTHRIQLVDLDLTATQKANDDHGVDFEVPANASLQ
jgi:hypothetical protein